MGTNFYVKADPTCDNPAHTETLHIGKSSAGWKFGFHAIPERGLTSWAAWREFLWGRAITNEYGEVLTFDEFRPIVEDRRPSRISDRPICRVLPTAEEVVHAYGGRRHPIDPEREYHDAEGFDFYDGEFS